MIRSATTLALGLLLAALPVSMSSDGNGTFGGAQVLAAAGGNGKGSAGGNGNGAANGHNANAAAAAAKDGKSQNKTQLAKNDPLHPHNLGRLNSFLSASSKALKNASADSAIGLIAQVYAGQLSLYIGGDLTLLAADPALDPLTSLQLQAAALTLATVANKPLSAEVIAAIHERLAKENPTLAGLASPTPEQIAADVTGAAATAAANATLVENILAAASSADSQITENGLGQIY